MKKGDFHVPRSDFQRAKEQFEERSERSQALDRAFRGPIPAEYETWAESPRRYDYPGVDTPTEVPRQSISDMPTPSGRATLTDRQEVLGTGDIGLTGEPTPLEGIGREKNAALDSLAAFITGGGNE